MRRAPLAILVAAAVAGMAASAEAQIPDTFTNLQVLPKDIKKADLVQVMRGFAGALGVRCQYCHVGAEAPDLEGADFASDAKHDKKVAREMMKMVGAINSRYLPPIAGKNPIKVECFTCHRGVSKPRTLERALDEAAAEKGIEGAVARYRELRKQYYGRASYDFGPRTLLAMAERRLEGKPAEAAALLDLGLEFHPDLSDAHVLRGDAHRALGEADKARAAYEKALALEPQNPQARRRLDEMKAPSPSPGP